MTPRDQSRGAGADDMRVLFVGNARGAAGDVSAGRFGAGIAVVGFRQLTADYLADYAPHFVVSPMLAAGFDILDVAGRLAELHFTGAYRVLTDPRVPDPEVVLREVRNQFPSLDIGVLDAAVLRGG